MVWRQEEQLCSENYGKKRKSAMIKKIMLIFKTHLDFGFTDAAERG